MVIGGVKVAPVGSKSYVRPITLASDGGAGGVVIDATLICVSGEPLAVLPTVSELMLRLTRLSADATLTDCVKTP